jgi:hypothetical protein
LKDLLNRHPDAETSGLLGSAAKVMAERACQRGDVEMMKADARAAADAYEAGFKYDVRAYYPGVNAVALRRLLGQRWDPNGRDLELAHEILPVVKYVARNSTGTGDASVWAHLTQAELHLHEYLLGDPDPSADPPGELAADFTNLNRLTRDHLNARQSISRQLRLMLAAGDPARLIEELSRRLEA